MVSVQIFFKAEGYSGRNKSQQIVLRFQEKIPGINPAAGSPEKRKRSIAKLHDVQ